MKFSDLMVIAIFTGNCLKEFHFKKGSEQKSKKLRAKTIHGIGLTQK